MAVGMWGNPRNLRNPFNPRFRHGWEAERTGTLIGLKQNVNRTSFVSLDDGLRLTSYFLLAFYSQFALTTDY